MNFLKRMFIKRIEVVECIEKHGMKVAVEQYGLDALLKFGLLFQYEGTKLYHDEFITYERVYNENGEYLGNITDAMAPFYQELGYFYGPCMNGNVVLSKSDEKKGYKTYAVFDRHAEILINYGSYCDKVFLRNGVALRGASKEENVKVITINPQGKVTHQPFVYIGESYITDDNKKTFTVTFPNQGTHEQVVSEDDQMLS